MVFNPDSRNKLQMPSTGFGVFQLSAEEAEKSVAEAFRQGFRMVDSSEAYGNETGTGRGLKLAGLPREEYFVITKLFPDSSQNVYGKDYQETKAILKRQLRELQLDYVDLYLIHAPIAANRMEEWRALTDLRQEGMVKHIGVSNYNVKTLEEIHQSGLTMPEVDEIEFHPIDQQRETDTYLDEHGIVKIAYSSLAPLSNWRQAPGEGGEVFADIKRDCEAAAKDIADRLGISANKVLLRYGMQHGYIVLSRSRSVVHIQDNLDLFNFELSQADMQRLDSFDQEQFLAWASSGINPMEDVPLLKK